MSELARVCGRGVVMGLALWALASLSGCELPFGCGGPSDGCIGPNGERGPCTSSTTSGGSSGGGAPSCPTVAELRMQASGSSSCLSDVVVLARRSPNAGESDPGYYYVADGTGAVLVVVGLNDATTGDPVRGTATAVAGEYALSAGDAGTQGRAEITNDVTLTIGGTARMPPPQIVGATQLDMINGDPSLVGQYVTVPAGTYYQDNGAPQCISSIGGATSIDCVKLTDSSGDTILVNTRDFRPGMVACTPTDGGQINLSGGGFNGVFDEYLADDGALHRAVFLGDCADLGGG